MKVYRWSDSANSLNGVIPQEWMYLNIFGDVNVLSIVCAPRRDVFSIFVTSGVYAIGSTSLVIEINFATPPFLDWNDVFTSIVKMSS